MSKSRTKTTALQPPTDLTGAEKVLADYATADAKLDEINSFMDQKIVKIREEHAADIQDLEEKKDTAFKQLQMYAESHPEHFTKKKSFPMSQGLLGFRTGTPKLKTLKGFTWAAVTKLLEASEKGKQYIKSTIVPMKDKILADRDKEEIAGMLPNVGIEVVQDESFYIELKKEEKAI